MGSLTVTGLVGNDTLFAALGSAAFVVLHLTAVHTSLVPLYLVHAEEARVERDHLREMCQLYGGRRLRRRLLTIDLRGKS